MRPIAPDGPGEKAAGAPADPGTEARDLAAADALHAHGTHQLVHRDRAGGDALDMGLPDHRRQRLRGGPAGLRGGRGAGAAPAPGDPRLARAGAGLPVALPLAVAQPRAVGAAPARSGAGHVAEEGRIEALLRHLAKAIPSPVVVAEPRSRAAGRDNPTLPRITAVAARAGRTTRRDATHSGWSGDFARSVPGQMR
ncbi:hypothetical protein GCM10010964_37400 [Caldovatus sediminis]|uniref:Uncharacterized protein n=1 Tax=Caldovatus sediminis TaxID=2041189 RepID=A0A8J3EDU8_9PROT|nr:hypothetical protein GCM10010964_37400 [Caldovatus sediminis]